jgi:hypothetical protein
VSALVKVTTVANEIEAEIVCALLRTEGIDATHRRTDFAAGAADASTTAAGPREIYVPAEDLDAARELLSAESPDDMTMGA